MNNLEDALPGYFRLAKNVSKHSDAHYQLGAVLVKGGKVISVGFNKNKYCGKFSYFEAQTTHAESQCLRMSGREDLKGSIMFIYRANKLNLPANAHPCKNCMKLLKLFGVKKILFTIDEYPFFEVQRV